MAAEKSRPSQDALAREIDKLLKKLPGADPTLKGDPEPSAVRPPTPRPGPGLGAVGITAGSRAGPVPGAEPSARAQKVGVWVRAILGAGLGVAVTQWPYNTSCGWPLYGYVGVIATVLLAGGWAATWAWRVRIAVAHVMSLILMFWGIVLAAEQILPRVGYAAQQATWVCGE